MGCDIHAIIERKKYWNFENSNGTKHVSWINAGDPDIGRWYYLFAILAECGRNYYKVPSISINRGVPQRTYKDGDSFDDTSYEFESMLERYGDDAHSTGWITLRELQAYDLSVFPPEARESVEPVYSRLRSRMERVAMEYDGDPDAVRLVFFFDN